MALMVCVVVIAAAPLRCPSGVNISLGSNATAVFVSCTAPVTIVCLPDAATGAWENVSISVVNSTFGGVACGGTSVTAIRNVTLALSGCGLAQDVAPLSAMNLTAGAAALSGSGISVHVVDSNLTWANPAGPVALLQLASFAELDGVLLTVVASTVSVVSNASASVVSFVTPATVRNVSVLLLRCTVALNVTFPQNISGTAGVVWFFQERAQAVLSAVDVTLTVCRCKLALVASSPLNLFLSSQTQPVASLLRVFTLSHAGGSELIGLYIFVTSSHIEVSAAEDASLASIDPVNAATTVDATILSLRNTTVTTRCVFGIVSASRTSSVVLLSSEAKATNTAVVVSNSTVVLESLSGVLSELYAQPNFTGSSAAVVVLSCAVQENVTVFVESSVVNASLLQSYAAFTPMFGMSSGVVVAALQLQPILRVHVSLVRCVVTMSVAFTFGSPVFPSIFPQVAAVFTGLLAITGEADNVTLLVHSTVIAGGFTVPPSTGLQIVLCADSVILCWGKAALLQWFSELQIAIICKDNPIFCVGTNSPSQSMTVDILNVSVNSAGVPDVDGAPVPTIVALGFQQFADVVISVVNAAIVSSSPAPQYLLVLNQSTSVVDAVFTFTNVTATCGVAAMFIIGNNVTVAVRGSALGGSASTPYLLGGLLNNGVAYVIENCTLTGFSRAVAPSMILYNGPRVALGCNAWQPSLSEPAVPLSRAVLMLPGSWVTYRRGVEGVYCPRVTVSVSLSATIEGVAPAVTPQASMMQLAGALTVALLPTAALVNPSGAAAMQGLLTQFELLACEVDDGSPLDLASSPTRLRVGASPLSYHYGAVLGNALALWCGAAVLCAAAALVVFHHWHRGEPMALRRVLGALRLPGWLLNVYLPLLQPTVASTVAIAAAAAGSSPVGVVCVVIGVAACAAPCCAATLLVTRWYGARVRASAEGGDLVGEGVCARVRASAEGGDLVGAGVCARVRAAAATLVRERNEYADAVRGSEFVSMYGALFARFIGPRHWFGTAELAHEVLLGVVSGTVSAAARSGSCAAPTVVALLVAVLMLLAMALLRPHNTALDACASYVSEVLLLVGCALILAVGSGTTAAATFLQFEMIALATVAVLPFALLCVRVVRMLGNVAERTSYVPVAQLTEVLSSAAGWPRELRLRVLVERICANAL
jgi:hypothetical protein